MLKMIKRSPFLSSLFIVLALFVGYCAYLANQPNTEVVFDRVVHSSLSQEAIGNAMARYKDWPLWHHSLKEVSNIQDPKSQAPTDESAILFKIENPKKQWKRFELSARIHEYEPNQKIALKLENDSTGRITRLFDRLEWKIELDQAPEGIQTKDGPAKTIIRGRAVAHTAHWRGRIFAGLSPRIIMNQVFYPDLVKLARIHEEIKKRDEPEGIILKE